MHVCVFPSFLLWLCGVPLHKPYFVIQWMNTEVASTLECPEEALLKSVMYMTIDVQVLVRTEFISLIGVGHVGRQSRIYGNSTIT